MQQSSRFNELNDHAKAILEELITSRQTLAESLQEQEEISKKQHAESRQFIEALHAEIRNAIVVAVNGAAASTSTQFQVMRREIENVSSTVARTQQDISRALEEHNTLAQALARAQTHSQRTKLKQRSNVATQTLYAFISAYKSLTVGYHLRYYELNVSDVR